MVAVLRQRLANVSLKGQVVHILGVWAIYLLCCRVTAAIDNLETNGGGRGGCAPIRLSFPKPGGWLRGCSVATPH